MENAKIRTSAKKVNVKIWEIAEGMGIAESTLVRRLRRELPEKQQNEILEIIQKIAAQKAKGAV